MDRRWEINQNQERPVLQALKESGIQDIPLSRDDLRNSVAAIDAISNLVQAKAVLKRLLKALAIMYLGSPSAARA